MFVCACTPTVWYNWQKWGKQKGTVHLSWILRVCHPCAIVKRQFFFFCLDAARHMRCLCIYIRIHIYSEPPPPCWSSWRIQTHALPVPLYIRWASFCTTALPPCAAMRKPLLIYSNLIQSNPIQSNLSMPSIQSNPISSNLRVPSKSLSTRPH